MSNNTDTNTVAEFDHWREMTLATAAAIGRRVFALRDSGYTGCGFHWQLERLFGICLAELSDYDSPKFHEGAAAAVERLNTQARWRHLLLRVDEAEASTRPVAQATIPGDVDYDAADEELGGLSARELRVRNEIDAAVEAACMAAGSKRVHVEYAAYNTDEEDCPINNLDAIAVPGPCVLMAERNEYWGGEPSKAFYSPLLHDPTWLQVCVYANQMIRRTRDRHHVYLESLELVKLTYDDGVPRYRFVMGS